MRWTEAGGEAVRETCNVNHRLMDYNGKLYYTISLNTWRLRQNGRHFPDDIFKCIFLTKNVWISIKISLKFVPGDPINNVYELLNLWALKFSLLNKLHIFQCLGKIFCVEFQRYPLKFHTKYLTHTLKDVIFIKYWDFKSFQIYELICVFEPTNTHNSIINPPGLIFSILTIPGHARMVPVTERLYIKLSLLSLGKTIFIAP